MPTVKFILKGKKNPSSIYLRFRHGRDYDITKTTSSLIIPPSV
jgi:hypothetical protein